MGEAAIKAGGATKMRSLFGRLFGQEKRTDNISYQVFSKYRNFLSGLDENDPAFENAYLAADLCEASYQTEKQRLVLVERIKQVEGRIRELEAYLKLSDEEAGKIKMLLTSFVSISKERGSLIYQLTGFDKSLPKLQNVLEDAKNAVPEIQYAEKHHRILRQDIGYLQGEREDLLHERELLEKGLGFVGKFRVWALGAFFAGMVLLTFIYVADSNNIFVPAATLGVLVAITIPLTHLFRRRMSFELKMNILKQNKAVQLLNKKNVVFAYYTNFLNYEYRKYRVRNSQSLRSNIKDYEHYKHVTTRIDNLRRNMYAIEREITKFLREHDISNSLSVDSFAHTVNIDDKLALSQELLAEKQNLERDLGLIEEKHRNTWEKIDILVEGDTTEERLIASLTQLYFDEADKLILTFSNESPSEV